MGSMASRIISVWRSGGVWGVYQESIRFLRSHPYRIRLYSEARHVSKGLVSDYEALAHPAKIIWISPNAIRHTYYGFDAYADVGKIINGDWDINLSTFDNEKRFVAIKRRYVDGLSWEDTGIYDHYMDRIEENGRYDGCYDKTDVIRRYEKIDEMYSSMKEHGYDISQVDDLFDHVCVHLSRNGEILHGGVGNHRLSIAQLLDLDEIPVRVVVRHAKWQEVREAVQKGEASLDHPDLRELQ